MMEGSVKAKEYVNTYLAGDLPSRLITYRNQLYLDDQRLPDPQKYLTFEPVALDHWPTIITLVGSTQDLTRIDYEADRDPIFRVRYAMRTYVWVRGNGPQETTEIRDNLCTVVRDALLDQPALRQSDSTAAATDIKVDEGTLREEFSDLTLIKGERFLAAAYLAYDLNLDEVVSRVSLYTMTSSTLTAGLIEKVPNAPTLLQASPGDTQVVLTWRASTWDGGGQPIRGYTVQASVDAGTTWGTEVADTGSTSPQYTVTELTNGTNYQFRVAALNDIGTGAYSSSSLVVTPSA